MSTTDIATVPSKTVTPTTTTKKAVAKDKKWAKAYKKDTGTLSIWLCLPIGMYAISHRWPDSIPAGDTRDIQVRTRRAKYLDRLRTQYMPELGKDEGKAGQGTDYGHRAFISADDLAKGMARIALKIDASGFKDHCVDNDLHDVYSRIWSAYVGLDDNSPYNKPYSYSGATYTWTKPNEHHIAKPLDCYRFNHWYNVKDGTGYCVDCGAVRTEVMTKKHKHFNPRKYTITQPPGSIVTTTETGTTLLKTKWHRVPGGPVIDGAVIPDTAPTTTHGLGYPTTAKPTQLPHSDPNWAAEPGNCLQFNQHWWDEEVGSTYCRDCGAKRIYDPAADNEWRLYYPEGSIQLQDELGYDLDEPRVTTPEEVTEAPSLDELCSDCLHYPEDCTCLPGHASVKPEGTGPIPLDEYLAAQQDEPEDGATDIVVEVATT